ncbi:MAG: PIN domain-containing protein [Pirellulales bacterium]
MALVVLRSIFLMVAIGLGVTVVKSEVVPQDPPWMSWVAFGSIMFIAVAAIVLDALLHTKRLDMISAVYFGMVIGLFLTYVLGLVLSPLPIPDVYRTVVQSVLGLVLCYTCISLLIQTKNDFRFIIPYVEFSKEVKGSKPYVLDTSVIIDGRIADVVETRVLDSPLIMPRFVIAELQGIADSSDRLRRSRGRRGLDILNRLRTTKDVDLQMYDHELPEFAGQPVDLKLVMLAKHVGGKIITNDYNLNKVARLQGVSVLNLNDLANALKPLFLPGENLELRIVKPGEEAGQGVGYLDDGTMVVVEAGREHVNKTVRVTVTSVLQTSAGRMVFGRCDATRQG